jgi:nucleoside-diphosphate-sugar epimerase
MRILVIGGTRFIGPHVVKRLAGAGHVVTVFHRGQTEAVLPLEVRHIHGERQRLADFRVEIREFAPDTVLDLCAFTEDEALVAVSMVKELASRAVVISSGDVYYNYGVMHGTESEPAHPHPFTEAGPLRQNLYPYRKYARGPDDPHYHYEKILVERVFMSSPDPPSTILRLPMVYGPGDPQHRLFPYLKRMDDQRPAILLDEGWARLCPSRGYVEDVAAAIALAVVDGRAEGREYNVAEPQAFSEAEWVRRIGQAVGWKGHVVIKPAGETSPGAGDILHLSMDSTRIREELGYREPVPPEEALCRTIAWERLHPPEPTDPKAFDYAAEDAALAQLERRHR